MHWQTVRNVMIGVAFGVIGGIGGFTFIYAQGYSYLMNDPRACANCHVMREQFDGWVKSSHRAVATCNDCHMPCTRVGGLKISDHHVRSPLLNINNACQTCHKWPEDE